MIKIALLYLTYKINDDKNFLKYKFISNRYKDN